MTMNIAIEFGGGEFRSLRREGGRLLARRISTDYLVIDTNESRRKILERHSEEFARCDAGMIVFGNAANELAELLTLPLQSALENGHLRKDDPVSRQFLGALVEGLLPVPQGTDSPCIVIASQDDQNPNSLEDVHFLTQLVKLRGYQPEIISPGLALILSECSRSGFTGVGIKMGAALLDISLVYQTRELARFTIPCGGQRVDRQIAISQNCFVRLQDGREVLDVRPIRIWREGVETINHISDSRTLELRNQYREIAFMATHRIQQELNQNEIRIPKQIPLVIGGTLAGPVGTDEMFTQAISEIELPIRIAEVSRVHNVRFSALRGGLILGEMVSKPEKSAA